MTITFPWNASSGKGGGVNRHGLGAVRGAEVDRDFFGRVEVKGLTGVGTGAGDLGDVGDATADATAEGPLVSFG